MKLKAIQKVYEFSDKSGYKCTVVAIHDGEWGWSASVTFSAEGMKTDIGAIKHLQYAVEHFLQQLNKIEEE